ncbi:MAG: uracil-DNA glycosylase [Fibrobacterota bacterium]
MEQDNTPIDPALLATYFQHQKEMGLPSFLHRTPAQDPSAEASEKIQKERPQQRETSAKPCPSSAEAPLRREEKRRILAAMYREVALCTGCHLHESRTRAVFGAGNVDAPVFIIGEAPGFHEDREGLPFVGKAGDLLTKMLKAIDLDRTEDVFISNILKCRPPENRNPSHEEAMTCLPYLKKQIETIHPRAILLLGRVAAQNLLQIHQSISSMKSGIYSFMDIPVMVTYHPAALLRNSSLKRDAWESLKLFRQLLERETNE